MKSAFYIFLLLLLIFFIYIFISEGIKGLTMKKMKMFTRTNIKEWTTISGWMAQIIGLIYLVISVAFIGLFSLIFYSLLK